MRRTALDTLQILRMREYEESLKTMADAVRALECASDNVRRAEETLVQEREAALSPASSDASVEHYALWLPVGQTALQEALEAQSRSAVQVAQARSMMISTRAALKAVETLQDQRVQDARARQLRAEQKIHDDLRPRRR